MTTRIDAEVLIPGRGAPIANSSVVFDGEAIRFAGPAADAPVTQGAEVVRARAVMPGMWQCHGHFLGMRTAALSTYFTAPVQLRSARVAKDAEAALQAGLTSVREGAGSASTLNTATGPAHRFTRPQGTGSPDQPDRDLVTHAVPRETPGERSPG